MFQLAVCSEMCPGFLTDNLPKFANFMTVVSAVIFLISCILDEIVKIIATHKVKLLATTLQ